MTAALQAATASRLRLDPLGVLLSAAGAAALMLLPFVVFKANRIVPGDPRALGEVLPAWGALACEAALLLGALVALGVADARVRLAAALLGVVAVALAVAAAGDALTPPGNKVVRIAPGAAFWVLLVALGLMATDAITRLRPGPGLRVLFLAMSFGIAALVLAHGTFDNLSVMREYAVNATRFAHEARRHVGLALGSLGAAVIVALPLGILCHRVPRLRAGGTRGAQRDPDDPGDCAVRHPHGAARCAGNGPAMGGRARASVASARPRRRWRCSCTRCCRSSPTRWRD